MRYILALVLCATPAAAHHEATVVTMLPSVTPFIVACAIGAASLWARWRNRK